MYVSNIYCITRGLWLKQEPNLNKSLKIKRHVDVTSLCWYMLSLLCT